MQHLVDHILLRQEALRTRIVQIAEAEVNRHLDELGQRLEHGYTLVRVLQERGISQQKVHTWLHAQLIVRAFIDRRVRLFIRVTESQLVQYYRDHQQIVGVPLDKAVREQIRRLLTERQVSTRLTELIESLRKRGNLEFPP